MTITRYCLGPPYLSPWSKVLLEKLVVAQLVKKFAAFIESEGFLLCSREPSSGPTSYFEEGGFGPQSHTLFLLDPF